MRYLIIFLLLCSCSPRSEIGPVGAETLNEVSANSDAVADRVEPSYPADAAILRLGVDTTKNVLELTANSEMRKHLDQLDQKYNSRVAEIKQQIDANAQGYVQQLKNDYEQRLEQVREESRPWYLKLGALIGGASILGLCLRTAVGIFGGPAWLIGLTNTIVGVAGAAKKIKQAHDTVGASEAGREALRQIDEQYSDKLKELGIGSLEAKFKQASKAWATDKGIHNEVHTVVKTVRNNMDTKDGRPI